MLALISHKMIGFWYLNRARASSRSERCSRVAGGGDSPMSGII